MTKGLYTQFVSRVAFPLHEWLKGHSSVSALRELERSQWLSGAELEQLRVSRLRGLLQRARDRVPYYRGRFERIGFDPDRVDSVSDLARLPLLTKDLIRAHGEIPVRCEPSPKMTTTNAVAIFRTMACNKT